MKRYLRLRGKLSRLFQRMMMGKKQKTPKGHEIPIPTKEEFETALDKVAKPEKKSPTRRPKN